MPRVILEELRQLAVSQAPGHASRFVLRWKDALGQDEAVAVLERDHEIVRMAYRWRTNERWSTVRQELTLQVARTATGGVYRMWRCPLSAARPRGGCTRLLGADLRAGGA